MNPRTVKCLLIGNVFETFITKTIDESTMTMNVDEIAGDEDYDRLRPLAYPQTDVAVMCFAMDDLASFERLQTKLIDEVRIYLPEIPMILLGLKTDLLSGAETADSSKFVTGAMMRDLFKEKRLSFTNCCSALNGDNVEAVFDEVIHKFLKHFRNRTVRHGLCWCCHGPCTLI